MSASRMKRMGGVNGSRLITLHLMLDKVQTWQLPVVSLVRNTERTFDLNGVSPGFFMRSSFKQFQR